MTWVRYDDNVANHPKIAPLDDATYRLWREALEWCAHNLTDGVILSRQLGVTSTRATPARARRLVDRGLWHRAGGSCTSELCPPSGPNGWVIHDYWDYQPKRLQVRAEQAAAAERQRNWRARKKSNGASNGVTHAVTNGVSNGNPAPPRPAPKGGGALRAPSADPPPVADGTAAAGDERSTPRCSTHPWERIPCPACAGEAKGAT